MSEAGEAVEVEDAALDENAGAAGEDAKSTTETRLMKRAAKGDGERQVKRPRWGDKAFEDITLGDVEQIVRKCNHLEKQVENNSEAVQELKEALKREKDLKKQLTVQSNEVEKIKSAIAKQMTVQMIYVPVWDAELAWGGSGKEVCAYIPNVSPELLKALGGELNHPKARRTRSFFDKVPSKAIAEKVQGSKKGLVLGSEVTLKYVKTSMELRVTASYTFGAVEKQKLKCKGKDKIVETGTAGEADAEEADAADAADDCGEDGAGAAENDEDDEALDNKGSELASNEDGGAMKEIGKGHPSNEDTVVATESCGGHGGA